MVKQEGIAVKDALKLAVRPDAASPETEDARVLHHDQRRSASDLPPDIVVVINAPAVLLLLFC